MFIRRWKDSKNEELSVSSRRVRFVHACQRQEVANVFPYQIVLPVFKEVCVCTCECVSGTPMTCLRVCRSVLRFCGVTVRLRFWLCKFQIVKGTDVQREERKKTTSWSQLKYDIICSCTRPGGGVQGVPILFFFFLLIECQVQSYHVLWKIIYGILWFYSRCPFSSLNSTM